ncbi:hypothetical protein H6790_00745 [Candidatus Nomurabacteria bacterium]|nr:hypothetical protein [Candidatus Nomurabacteria bacterium]MCB9820461.1 hypothetical protein [Candidatus Nomurabacteria bacterium]
MKNINTPKRKDKKALRNFIYAEYVRLFLTILVIVLGILFLRYINHNYENNFIDSFSNTPNRVLE